MQPYQNLNAIKRIAALGGDEKKLEWVQHYLNRGFKAIEAVLEKTSGLYCIGDSVSIADICLIPPFSKGIYYEHNVPVYRQK